MKLHYACKRKEGRQFDCLKMLCWPCIIVYQHNETKVMHFSFNLLRIKSPYMFQALLAHPQEVLHKRQLVYCVCAMSAGCTMIAVKLQSWQRNIGRCNILELARMRETNIQNRPFIRKSLRKWQRRRLMGGRHKTLVNGNRQWQRSPAGTGWGSDKW
jgi:hypothetical protein